jgi:hypothetical protein
LSSSAATTSIALLLDAALLSLIAAYEATYHLHALCITAHVLHLKVLQQLQPIRLETKIWCNCTPASLLILRICVTSTITRLPAACHKQAPGMH